MHTNKIFAHQTIQYGTTRRCERRQYLFNREKRTRKTNKNEMLTKRVDKITTNIKNTFRIGHIFEMLTCPKCLCCNRKAQWMNESRVQEMNPVR